MTALRELLSEKRTALYLLGRMIIVKPRGRNRIPRGEVGKIAPHLLERSFEAKRPNRKWETELTAFHP